MRPHLSPRIAVGTTTAVAVGLVIAGLAASGAFTGGTSHAAASVPPARHAVVVSSTILIGSVAGTSGAYGTTGVAMLDGALLAVDQLNSRGGALKKKFTLQSYDDEASPALATKLFRRLVAAGAVAVAGSGDSGPATAAAAQALKIPDIGSLDDGAATITPGGVSKGPLPWVWNSGSNPAAVGAADAAYALKSCTALAVLHDPTSFGDGGASAISSAYTAAHRHLVLDEAVNENWASAATVSLTGAVTKLKVAKADCVVAWLTPQDTAGLARAIAAAHAPITILGDDETDADSTFTALAGAAANGVIAPQLTAIVHPDKALTAFEKTYRAKFHLSASVYAVANYDAVMILGQVIKRENSTSAAKLLAGLNTVTAYQGLQGTVTFTSHDHTTNNQDQLTLVKYDAATKAWNAVG